MSVLLADTILPEDKDVTFLICESLREEKHGKNSLLGWYSGTRIVVPEGTKEAQFPVAIIFVVDGGRGNFKSSISLISPTGKPVLDNHELPPHDKKENSPNIVVLQLIPFKTSEFGTFRAQLKLDDKTYERVFSITPGTIPA